MLSRVLHIFDVDAGFLDDEWLSGQMRLLVGLVTADEADRRARVPQSWQGYEDALALRLDQLIAEMQLRGLAPPQGLPRTTESIIWPAEGTRPLTEQVAMLAERAQQGHVGRIRLPRNDHELWACYKYSVLARNHQSYSRLGQQVAARAVPLDRLWRDLVNAARVAPGRGGILNALQHMWGYVSKYALGLPDGGDLRPMLVEIQRLAAAHDVGYLLNSTALGELMVWL